MAADVGSVRPKWAPVVAVGAIVFGALTLFSGGSALFGSAETRGSFGNIVPFVLWFNFLSGFVYLAAGVGFFLWKRWAAQLSALLAAAIMLVFVAFGWHVAVGGAFEARTVAAMTLRSVVWIAIAIVACRSFNCFERGRKASEMPMNGSTR